MKSLRVKYQITYSALIRHPVAVKIGVEPGSLVVRDITILSPKAREHANEITLAGFLMVHLKEENVGRYQFIPQRVDILSTEEIDEAVAPSS